MLFRSVLYSDRPAAAGKYSCEISNGVGSDVCHAHVSLGKGKSTDLPTAFHSSATLSHYFHFLRWSMITLISLLTEENVTSLFNTENMKQSLLCDHQQLGNLSFNIMSEAQKMVRSSCPSTSLKMCYVYCPS